MALLFPLFLDTNSLIYDNYRNNDKMRNYNDDDRNEDRFIVDSLVTGIHENVNRPW